MDANTSTPELEEQLADQLLELTEKLGTQIHRNTTQEAIKIISELSPWFSLTGNLNIEDWEQVRADLRTTQRERGAKTVPLALYSLWRLVKKALLNKNVLVQERLGFLNKTLEEIQNVESINSIKSFKDREDKDVDVLDQEEKLLQGEIALLTKQVEEEKDEAVYRDTPVRLPSQRAFSASISRYATAFTPVNPKAEPREFLNGPNDLGRDGPMCSTMATLNRQACNFKQPHRLTFKMVKQLKDAVTSYGPHAQFTIALMESFLTYDLSPRDWIQLCKACLSGGDFLLWRGDFRRICKKSTELNAACAGLSQRELETLISGGPYSALPAQTAYSPAIRALVAAAAAKAWGCLPVGGAAELLSKIIQGPTESYSTFVSRLLEAGNRSLGDVEANWPAMKLLAYENANRSCQEVLRLHRDKDLEDFIQICRDVVPRPIATEVIESSPRGVATKARTDGCFQCGKPGHVKKNCPTAGKRLVSSKSGPGICPRCKKGEHWASQCRSSTDVQGNPLPLPKNGKRGLRRAPENQIHEALSKQSTVSFIPQRNVPQSASLSEAMLEVQE